MRIVPTIEPCAKREGRTIIVELQDDVSLSLSLNQALTLYHSVQREARAWLSDATAVEPKEGQVIAFPVHATREPAQ